FQLGKRSTLSINLLQNTTKPFVDSLNSQSIQSSYMYLAARGKSIGMIGEFTRFKNQAYKRGIGVIGNLELLRRTVLSLMIRYDYVDGIWNLENEDIYSGRIVITRSF